MYCERWSNTPHWSNTPTVALNLISKIMASQSGQKWGYLVILLIHLVILLIQLLILLIHLLISLIHLVILIIKGISNINK